MWQKGQVYMCMSRNGICTLNGAMYTWKGKNKEVEMKNGRFIALCWLVAAGGCLLGYGLAVWLVR